MVRNPVVGRYRLYKEGTAKLGRWLAKTASRCGDVATILGPVPKRKSTPSTNESDRRPSNETSVSVSARDMVELAGAITPAGPGVTIPASILEVVVDVNAGCQACAKWYSTQAMQEGSSMSKQDQSHRHFIDILKDVRDILEAAHEEHSVAGQPAMANEEAGKSATKR